MREFKLPEFKSIFPVKENKYFNNDLISNWIDELNASSNFGVEHLPTINSCKDFVKYMFIDVSDQGKLELLVKILVMYFIFDDHTECNDGDINRDEALNDAVWNEVRDVLNNVKSKQFNKNWKPYVKLLYHTIERAFQNPNMPNESKDRFIKFYKEYCDGTIDETKYCNHEFNDINKLFDIKIKSMAFRSVIGLIEIAYDLYLSNLEWEDADLKNILNLASHQMIYVNDLFSFEKEFNEQNKILKRIPNIIAHQLLNMKDNTSFKDKVETVYKNIIEDIQYYEDELSSAIKKFLNNDEKTISQIKFVNNLIYVISGTYFTFSTNIRYN